MIPTSRSLFISTALLLSASCGGKSTPAETPPTADTSTPAETAPPADMAFKDMTVEQRTVFMKQTVLPAMQTLFQEFDAKKFATFNCKTCHGKSADDGTFKMPNPNLPRLPKPEDFMAYAKEPEHAPWVEFMAMKVKPQMAKLLKMSEFDPQTNTGDFSCGACHLAEGQEPGQAPQP